MAVTVTVGTNSYISVADADTYFNARLYSTAWTGASSDDRARALIQAAKVIDRQFLKGRKRLTDQALAFPRCYTVDQRSISGLNYIGNVELVWDGSLWCETLVPQAIMDAQCEEALALLDRGNSKRIRLQKEGVTGFNIGDLSESFNKMTAHNRLNLSILSLEARELLRPYMAGAVGIT